ncbi:MAG TPA: ABC transporter ATP-binding protein [Nitrososphaerales archaeon]|nr:ABC transporter ATP-binding protein [Nitrososphaerales archaeon]
MALLEIQNLVSGYGKMAIIQDISLDVDQGDFVALVGPNGSGKSTLVKSILNLTNIFEGKVIFDGKQISGEKTEKVAKMRLGYVPQVSNVFSDMSVSENLEMGGTILKKAVKKKEIRQRVANLFPILEARSRQKAGLLSGGERQMLAVGRALMGDPKLIILDEPTAALAPIAADQLFQKLGEIRTKLGVTIILVEQNARRALALANRGIVLVQGKKVFEGTPDQVLKDT